MVVDANNGSAAVAACHTAFNFSHMVVPMLLLAPPRPQPWSNIAEALLELIKAQAQP